jgi:hypothetical protein
MSCPSIQERLSERALARALDDPEREAAADRSHAAGCAACGAHLAFLRALEGTLAEGVESPSPAVLDAARRRAARVLRSRARPAGLRRVALRSFGLALAAVPVVLLHAYLVVWGASTLLAPWLPAPLLDWLGVVYFGSLALAIGALSGAIPLAVAAARGPRAGLA